MKLDHIGIAVKNLAVARELYSSLLNQEPYKKETVETDRVTTLFYQTGESKLELLEPTADDSPIRRFIEKKGEGLHHIAFEVDDLQKSIEELKLKGFSLIDPLPRRGADNKMIVFLNPRECHGVLIELCQSL